ncbi:hypothetical protein SNEBB_008584 [Seison nebaliae]|nr:hypothetical protein SNEBB_008584 [Seison nebaliae]
MIAFGKNFHRDLWNIFDLIIVAASLADVLGDKRTTVRMLLWTFLQSLKALPYVCLLMLMFFLIYAIVGMQIFGNIALDDGTMINRHNNFRTIFSSIRLLFRVVTGEGWPYILMGCLPVAPCDEKVNGEKGCGSNFAYIYFTSFIFIMSFMMLNLFVAVIMDNFDYLTRDSSILGSHHLDEYIREWAKFDPEGKGYLHYKKFVDMIQCLMPPLGFGKNCPKRIMYMKLIRMNMPLTRKMKVNFTSSLMALIRESLQIAYPKPGEDRNKSDKNLRLTLTRMWPEQTKKRMKFFVPTFSMVEDPNHRRLTVGKIYAGKLIWQNWITYKNALQKFYEKRKEMMMMKKFNLNDTMSTLSILSDYQYDSDENMNEDYLILKKNKSKIPSQFTSFTDSTTTTISSNAKTFKTNFKKLFFKGTTVNKPINRGTINPNFVNDRPIYQLPPVTQNDSNDILILRSKKPKQELAPEIDDICRSMARRLKERNKIPESIRKTPEMALFAERMRERYL